MHEKLKSLFYRPEFFRRQTFTGSQALTFYSLTLLVLVIGCSLLILPALFGVSRYFDSSAWREQQVVIENLYPDHLVLSVDQGRLTTNQTDPVIIPFPDAWREEKPYRNERRQKEELPTNLVIIDKEAIITRQAFIERDTLVLANETEIGFHSFDRGETRIFAISEAKLHRPFALTSAAFDYWVGQIAPMAKTAILLLLCVLPLFMYMGLWIGYLIYSLLGALVVWLAAHIRGHNLTYGRAYLSTLYLLPLPFLVSFLSTLFGVHHFPLLFSLVLFLTAIMNFPMQVVENNNEGGTNIST